MITELAGEYRVSCPTCHAGPGELCAERRTWLPGSPIKTRGRPHPDRVLDAIKAGHLREIDGRDLE